MMVLGPLAGGALGAVIAADRQLKSRPGRSIAVGPFVPAPDPRPPV
jgi:hypothetical protein